MECIGAKRDHRYMHTLEGTRVLPSEATGYFRASIYALFLLYMYVCVYGGKTATPRYISETDCIARAKMCSWQLRNHLLRHTPQLYGYIPIMEYGLLYTMGKRRCLRRAIYRVHEGQRGLTVEL